MAARDGEEMVVNSMVNVEKAWNSGVGKDFPIALHLRWRGDEKEKICICMFKHLHTLHAFVAGYANFGSSLATLHGVSKQIR
jgi:hypothetical protein